jgi:hypothetical protein
MTAAILGLIIWSLEENVGLDMEALMVIKSPSATLETFPQQSSVFETVTTEESIITSIPTIPNTSHPWGIRRILDPYRDLVFFTIVQPADFQRLCNLVGSIHRMRPLATQQVPLVYVYGNLKKREVDEISLWRNVVYQDLQHVLTPYMIVEGDQVLDKTNKLVSAIEKGIFKGRDVKSLKYHLMSRMVQMHGHAIYIANGNVFEEDTLQTLFELLEKQMYFALKSVYGEVILEAYVAETEPFQCVVQAIWNPSIARKCEKWKSEIGKADGYKVDEPPSEFDEKHVNECGLCFRDDAHHGWRFFKDYRQSSKERGGSKAKKRVALAFPTTSRGTKEFWDLPFLSIFLPSIIKSLTEEELGKFELVFYIGYDEGDRVYDNRELLRRIIAKTKTSFNSIGVENIKMNIVRLGISRSVTFIWNALFSLAISDGVDYFYQLNDDVRFVSIGWLGSLVMHLKRQAGFGLAGPFDPAFDCKIMTQTMVSPIHFNIFGWFFPPDFRNWQCDTWISGVYAGFGRCFPKMIIYNGRLTPSGTQPRYQPCRTMDFRPLILFHQLKLKNSQGKIDPSLYVNMTI